MKSLTMFFVVLCLNFSTSLAAAKASVFKSQIRSNGLAETVLPVDQAFQFSSYIDEGQLHLMWQILPGYYLYQNRFKLEDAKGQAVKVPLPKGMPYEDEYFGEVTIYRLDLAVAVDLGLLAHQNDGSVLLRYQGCADAGYCYPPQKRVISLGQ